jgi:thioredoxin reductase (NADPH)
MQAERFGAKIRRAVEITAHDLSGPMKTFELDEEEQVAAPAVIIATGAKPRELGVPGESKYRGRGISYCATCDGAYFDGKEIHVIGGGNSAVEESLFLTQFAKKVTIIHQFDHFQAEPVSAAEALANPKIEVIWDSEPRGFLGENQLDKLRIENVKTKEVRELSTDGVFVFVGYVPRTDLLKGHVKMNQWGYVETGEDMSTEIPGVYVAGDIRSKRFRQITTAVADGTIAALAVQKFVKDHRQAA